MSDTRQDRFDEDSDWCQEHGHTGLLVGSVCEICDALAAEGTKESGKSQRNPPVEVDSRQPNR